MDCTPISFRYSKARALWSGNTQKDPPFQILLAYYSEYPLHPKSPLVRFVATPSPIPARDSLSGIDGTLTTHRPSPTVPILLQEIYRVQQRVPASGSTSNEACSRGWSYQWSSCVLLLHLGCAFLSLEQPTRESLDDTKTRAFYETCAI